MLWSELKAAVDAELGGEDPEVCTIDISGPEHLDIRVDDTGLTIFEDWSWLTAKETA